MKLVLQAVAALVTVHLTWAKSIHGGEQPGPEAVAPAHMGQLMAEPVPVDEDPEAEANRLANQVNADADNAKQAADVAKQAAVVANSVAEHSIKITSHAKSALTHALGALHDARVESSGLNRNQKDSLKSAEAKLREATKSADYGKLKKVKNSGDLQKEKMQKDLDKKKGKSSELGQMKTDVRELRSRLKKKGGDAESDKELADLEADIEKLEKQDGKVDASTNDELKAEIERLRTQVDKMENEDGAVNYDIPENKKRRVHELPAKKGQQEDKQLMKDVQMQPLEEGQRGTVVKGVKVEDMKYEATPVQEKGIDIDTAMPYGDLEPFGREDTAQELTESSVRESDEMVDQLERAEVAEEKRAVFRALTRLRGAAITSFDGVARSQTGNIDEYNKIHKWRKTHPMHHLADEESDVTKWAFPDNADLVQVASKEPKAKSKTNLFDDMWKAALK